MSEETVATAEEAVPTVRVKFIRPVDYKGVGFAKGVEADLEPHIAERQIAEGNAVEVAAKPEKKAK